MKTIEELTALVKRYKAGEVTEANMQAQIARFAAAVRREALEAAERACEAQADRAKARELSERCEDRRGQADADELAALKFYSTVSTFNAGVDKCKAAIRALLN